MTNRRRRRLSGVPIIIVLAVLLLLVVSFGVIFVKYNNSRLLPGTWSRTIDVSSDMEEYIRTYLKDATLGSEIDVSKYVPEAFVKISVIFDKNGTFETHVDAESYEEALKSGREALKEALKDLITKRLEVSYIETQKDVDTLVNEALGMNLDSYLDEYGPQILPPLSDFDLKYSFKGYYKSDKDFIYFTDYLNLPLRGETSNKYLISDDTLVINFSDGACVYARSNS